MFPENAQQVHKFEMPASRLYGVSVAAECKTTARDLGFELVFSFPENQYFLLKSPRFQAS